MKLPMRASITRLRKRELRKMKKSNNYEEDIKIIVESLQGMSTNWDGKQAIMELKEIDYQWRQMEWIGFYFESLCKNRLNKKYFTIPGKKYGNVIFDSFCSINWDMKSSAIKSHNHKIILNDQAAIDASVEEHGNHGIILALLDVEYNDDTRSFQKWHADLKGGISEYEKNRKKRNATSRYRKTSAELKQILLLIINRENLQFLGTYKQGRNSDGSPRKFKYMLDIEKSEPFDVGRIDLVTTPLC